MACSLLKLGSLKKTIIASLFHSGLHLDIIFCGKNVVICYSRKGQVMPFFDKKKRPKFFMMPNWFFDDLQLFLFSTFFDQVHNKGSALEIMGQSWTKMEESRLWGSYSGQVFFLVEIHDNLDFLNFVLLPVSELFTRFICFSNDSCYNLTKASCLLKPNSS